MSRRYWMLLGLVVIAGVALVVAPAYAGKAGAAKGAAGKKSTATGSSEPKAYLPEDASKAIKDALPSAVIGEVKAITEGGMLLYSVNVVDGIASKNVVVSSDGTIEEIGTQVSDAKDIPAAAAKAIEKAAEGGLVVTYRKVELRAEIKEVDGSSKLVKLATTKTAYAADLSKGDKVGKVKVDADGKVITPVSWESKPTTPTTPTKTTDKKKGGKK